MFNLEVRRQRLLLYLLLGAAALLTLLYTFWVGLPVEFQKNSLEYIRKYHLFPHDLNAPTNYSGVHIEYEHTMAQTVAKRLNFKKYGFFLECGANDGAFLSNSLHLEREYGWSGLLVEADPASVPTVKWRNRRAWVADVCLSSKPYPMVLEMTGHGQYHSLSYFSNDVVGRGEKRTVDGGYNRTIQVQCYPLATLMDAIGRSHIDYLSLDVEGMELDILKTIPFPRISIQLISVEVRGSQAEDIRNFLEPIGYKRIEEVRLPSGYMQDDLYEFQKPVTE